MIAALFVATNGPYFGLPGVDPWDARRDARKYAGPWAVICHPPCERWGRYWSGGPNPNAKRQKLGDDGGCFEAALNAVLTYGGVLEHPAHTMAYEHFGIQAPPIDGGWQAQLYRNQMVWTCHVEQGNYGHRARKATWLLAAKVSDLPLLKWGASSATARLDDGYHSTEERREREREKQGLCASSEAHQSGMRPHSEAVSRSIASNRRAKERGLTACEFLSRKQRMVTPAAFRDLLIAIAEKAGEPDET